MGLEIGGLTYMDYKKEIIQMIEKLHNEKYLQAVYFFVKALLE